MIEICKKMMDTTHKAYVGLVPQVMTIKAMEGALYHGNFMPPLIYNYTIHGNEYKYNILDKTVMVYLYIQPHLVDTSSNP